MSASALFSLFGLLFVLAVVPSASVALVVSRSATLGPRSGVATVAGIVLADLGFTLLALSGMSALAESLGSLFAIVRYAAGAYLIWTGAQLLRSKANASPPVTRAPRSSILTSFASGFLLTLGDVKAIVFYASLFPAFLDMTRLDASDMAALALATTAIVGAVKLSYALAAQRIISRLHGRTSSRTVRIAAGTIMIGAGTAVIVKP